jgi:VCBS repeat-containing protein
LVDGPDHGDLDLAADGSFVYTPSLNFHGQDSFSYRAFDGQGYSSAVPVSLTITAVNDVPVAVGETYTTTEDVTLTVVAPGVLANDDDVDNDPLAAVLVTDVAHGQLALQPDGSFVYTPTAGYSGPDSFSYRASDGLLHSNPVSVLITVEAGLEFELYLPTVLKP